MPTAHYVEISHEALALYSDDPVRVGPYPDFWSALVIADALENGQIPLPLPMAKVRAEVVPILFTEAELPKALDKLAERVSLGLRRRNRSAR